MAVTMATHNGVYGRRPHIRILSASHVHDTVSILGAWYACVGPCRLDSRRAFVTARVRAAGQEFQAGLLAAPGRIPQTRERDRSTSALVGGTPAASCREVRTGPAVTCMLFIPRVEFSATFRHVRPFQSWRFARPKVGVWVCVQWVHDQSQIHAVRV